MKSPQLVCVLHYFCRREETRTPDPHVPNVVRYQLRYSPKAFLCSSSVREKLGTKVGKNCNIPYFSVQKTTETQEKWQFLRKKLPENLAERKNVPIFALANKQQGAIAQLVEQRTENPCVPGSIPGGTTLRKSKSLQTPDFQTKSGVFLFPRNAKNGNIFPVPVEQKVEQKGGRKISTSNASFALICNILRIKKARKISYFCKNK